jgi:hypothetical protein
VLSGGYRRLRGEHAEAAASLAEARGHRARRLAAAIVAVHGPHLRIEEGDIRAWFRLWAPGLPGQIEIWSAARDTIRTLCLAPPPDVRATLERFVDCG